MRWDDFRRSDNVEDNRAASASRGGLPGGAGGLGIGTIVIIGLISWYFGIDPSVLLNGAQILTGGSTSHQTAPPVPTSTPHDRAGDFIAAVLGDTEDRWKEIFTANGRTYHPPRLRLFTRSEPTPCAFAQSAMGPFYCPHDRRIYLDVAFFEDLQNKFGACSDSNGLQVLAGLRDCPRGRPSRAERARHSAAGDAAAAGVYEPRRDEPAAGARRAAGGLFRRHLGEPGAGRSTISSIPAMSTRRCRLPPPSAMTACKSNRRAMSCPMPSPTAPREQRKRWFLSGFNQGKISACDTMSAGAL